MLNGKNGTALVLDTDGGAYDHDTHYDRAVGPMQFVPATWRELGRDGNGDGIADPNNMYDATLTAASYLCGDGRDLAKPADLRAAILAYNPSSDYVRTVLAWAAAYRKAGASQPALDSVPDPLVLGAGGDEGDDPFGDSSVDDASFIDDGSSILSDDPGILDVSDTSGISTTAPTPHRIDGRRTPSRPRASRPPRRTASPQSQLRRSPT